MRVSMGVLPTSLTKKSCSITEAETVRSEGSLRRSFPNLVGWLGYWVRQYSSRAHWDFSCSCSITGGEVRPTASESILISCELWRVFVVCFEFHWYFFKIHDIVLHIKISCWFYRSSAFFQYFFPLRSRFEGTTPLVSRSCSLETLPNSFQM